MLSISKSDLEYMVEKEMTLQEMADYYGSSITPIRMRIERYGIDREKYRNIGNSHARKYSINEDFFKTWTSESAWMYGWALGDGGYTWPYVITFDLARLDREVLDKFKSVLESEHPIKDYERYNKEWLVYSKLSHIQFNSKELFRDLNGLSYYDVPKCYFDDFLRGFFEAEGSLRLREKPNGLKMIVSTIYQKDTDILEFIWYSLKQFDILPGGSMSMNKETGVHMIVFNTHDTISLYHYMYDNCGDLFLARKKEKMEKMIEEREMSIEEIKFRRELA